MTQTTRLPGDVLADLQDLARVLTSEHKRYRGPDIRSWPRDVAETLAYIDDEILTAHAALCQYQGIT